MQRMHIAGIDLNLAVVLHALLEERSVSRAGQRVGLSQSATSHALSRLRDILKDPLFVRTPRGFVPTARASELAATLAEGLASVERAMFAPAAFDATTAKRTFRIGSSDYADHVVMPSLMEQLASDAPGMDVWTHSWPTDPVAALANGDVDLFTAPTGVIQGVTSAPLWDDHFVSVCRRGHPLLRGKLTAKRYADANHVLIAPTGRPGGGVDVALAERGLARRVAFMTPSFFVAPHIVAKTDFILTIASRVASTLPKSLGLVTFTPPVSVPGFTMAMYWHARHATDPAHQYLRDALSRASSKL